MLLNALTPSLTCPSKANCWFDSSLFALLASSKQCCIFSPFNFVRDLSHISIHPIHLPPPNHLHIRRNQQHINRQTMRIDFRAKLIHILLPQQRPRYLSLNAFPRIRDAFPALASFSPKLSSYRLIRSTKPSKDPRQAPTEAHNAVTSSVRPCPTLFCRRSTSRSAQCRAHNSLTTA